MIGFFFDTETTGLVQRDKPSTSPEQPNLVQLAGILADIESRREIASINLIVYPEGWDIPERSYQVHGITPELAQAWGINLENAVYSFVDLASRADFLCCHNTAFDKVLMERAKAITDIKMGQPVTSPWQPHHQFICTMLAATDVVKARKKYPKHDGDWKWPTLTECHQHFWQKDVVGAHDALVDIRATMELFYQLKDMGIITVEQGVIGYITPKELARRQALAA